MNKIALITDSSANISTDWIEQYNIKVIPLKIQYETKTYLDGVDISPNMLFSLLSNGVSVPTTSQPSIQDFINAFENVYENTEGILLPLISSGISGTVASAQAAAQQFSRMPVEIIDTHATAMGQVLIILAAARAIEKGLSLNEVKKITEDVAKRLHIFFTVDTLEYLYRGGRINKTSRYLGTALDIKPILYFNSDGKLEALERVRTRRNAFKRLITLTDEQAGKRLVHIGIAHSNALQAAQELRKEIEQLLNCAEVIIVEFSSAISVHVGPGALGIALYTEY